MIPNMEIWIPLFYALRRDVYVNESVFHLHTIIYANDILKYDFHSAGGNLI